MTWHACVCASSANCGAARVHWCDCSCPHRPRGQQYHTYKTPRCRCLYLQGPGDKDPGLTSWLTAYPDRAVPACRRMHHRNHRGICCKSMSTFAHAQAGEGTQAQTAHADSLCLRGLQSIKQVIYEAEQVRSRKQGGAWLAVQVNRLWQDQRDNEGDRRTSPRTRKRCVPSRLRDTSKRARTAARPLGPSISHRQRTSQAGNTHLWYTCTPMPVTAAGNNTTGGPVHMVCTVPSSRKATGTQYTQAHVGCTHRHNAWQ